MLESEQDEFTYFLEKIKGYKENVEKEHPPSLIPPSQFHLIDAGKSISHEITKLTLLVQHTPKVQKDFFRNTLSVLDELFTIYGNLVGGAGPTLQKQMKIAFKNIFESVENLVLEFRKGENLKLEANQTKQLVGVVWEYCDNLQHLPFTNRESVATEISKFSEIIKDAFQEIQDLSANLATSSKEDFEDGLEDDESEFSENEKKLIEPVSLFVKSSFNLLDTAWKILAGNENLKPLDIRSDVISNLEKLLLFAMEISKYVDEVCVGIYPPQDAESLQNNVQKWEENILNFGEVLNILNKDMKDPKIEKLMLVMKKLVDKFVAQIYDVLKS